MIADIPQIETERLILRAPQAADLPTFTAFYATKRSHMVGGPRDADESFKALTSRIGHWAVMGYGLWHLEDSETGAFLGWAGLMNPPSWDEPELGWTVFEQAEGKGLAFEAVTAARAYAASHQGLHGVISYIHADNERSAALAGRLGAVVERSGEVLGTPCQIWRHPKEVA